jgi:hypothetical protein
MEVFSHDVIWGTIIKVGRPECLYSGVRCE